MLFGEIVVVLLPNLVLEMQTLNFGAHPNGAKLLNFGRLGHCWHGVGGLRIPTSREDVHEVRHGSCLSSNPCDQRLQKEEKKNKNI